MSKGMFTSKPDKKLAKAYAKKMQVIDDTISESVPESKKATLFDFGNQDWLSVDQKAFLCQLYNVCYLAWDVEWGDVERKRNLWLKYGTRYPVRRLNSALLKGLTEHHLIVHQDEQDAEPFVKFSPNAFEMMRGCYESMCREIGELFTNDEFWRNQS